MKKTLLFIWGIFMLTVFPVFSQDKLSDILKKELMRNFEILKKQDVPVYYISLRVEESTSAVISSSNGALSDNNFDKSRKMVITMRVGSREFDNMHYSGNMRNITMVYLPDQDVEEDIKLTLWRSLQEAYTKAKDQLESNRTEQTTRPQEEDKSPDFSIEKASQYYEKPMKFEELGYVEKDVTEKMNNLSKILNLNRDILTGYVACQANLSREYFIDTDGASIVQNDPSVRIYMGGFVIANDGMILQDYKTYFGRKFSELPPFEQITSETKDLSKSFSVLKAAPKIDSYTGPVILGAEVSGVFFHEFFGHRVEGARMKSGFDAQTLKKKIGELILPDRISVIFDPTIDKYNGKLLSGNYKYDDEGVAGQRVEVIKNGVLKNFLMSRIPIEGFPKSNGHGRGNIGIGTETRQSNLIVESSKPVTTEQLYTMFKDELKKRNLQYGYRIDKVSGGLTMMSAASANVFYLNPFIVYKVYADGRPDELVRGVNIVGTPLAAFSQIIAESNDQNVFNGMCGALSGSVPVSAVAPTMLIKELEFQKIGDNQKIDPFILDRP